MGRTFAHVLRQELRLLAADRILWVVIAVFSALMVYGMYNGAVRTADRDAVLAALMQEEGERMDSLVRQYRAIVSGEEKADLFFNPLDPSWVGGGLGARYAIMPSAPLTPLALGQIDFLPNYFKVTSYDKTTFMNQDTLENPWHLMNGHLDVAFVIVCLLPLLIFALTYNLLSGEREQGTLRMLLSQPLRFGTLVAAKVASRALVLFTVALLIPIAGGVLMSPLQALHGAFGGLLAWSALVIAYGLFWFSLALAVDAWGKSSATNAVILLGAWVLLVFVLPVVMNVVVTKTHPMPSRVDLMTHVRDAITDGRERYRLFDREDSEPEAMPEDDEKILIQGFMMGWWRLYQDLREVSEPLLYEFDAQLGKQQDMVDRYRFLSPAVAAYEAMSDLAGTGLRRYRHFIDQVYEFHEERRNFFYPKVMSETRMKEADFDLIPRFEWKEEDSGAVAGRILTNLGGLLLMTAVLLAVGMRLLRSYPRA